MGELQLEDLRQVVGGQIRESDHRRWLEASVGGLRTFVLCRRTHSGTTTFDLAVFTPHTSEIHPFFAKYASHEWCLAGERVLPRLQAGFVFAGCHAGILFALNTGEPSLLAVVITLSELAEWAQKPWRPTADSPKHKLGRAVLGFLRENWIRLGLVLVVVSLVLWLRADVRWLLPLVFPELVSVPRDATAAAGSG